jgi:hypothetical protein
MHFEDKEAIKDLQHVGAMITTMLTISLSTRSLVTWLWIKVEKIFER